MMKKQSIYIALVAGSLFLWGCKKGFLDVNTNPNNPASADPALVFTNALQSTAIIVASDFGENSANVTASLANPQNYISLSTNYQVTFSITRNNYTSSDFTGVWTDSYHNLNDYNYVEQNGVAQSKWFLVAAAKVMKAFDFQMLVDCYNDVPYSQALQLASSESISTPTYDKGQDVYNSIIQQIDSAITIFETPSLLASYSVGSADILWAGDPVAWVQFANTLKLRILLHEINVSGQQATITAEAQKIANDANGLMGAGVSALINPGYASDATTHLNPLWATIGYTITGAYANPDLTSNSYFISKLTGYNDPRIGYFYNTNGGGTLSGNPFGIPSNPSAGFIGGPTNLSNSNNIPFNFTLPAGASAPSSWGILQSAKQSSILLSAWESEFLQSEAVLRGLLPGGNAGAKQLYEQAITDNFTYLNVFTYGNSYDPSAGDWASAYYAQNIANVGWAASSGNYLQAIITQKYISLCLTDLLESWTDYRRTGYPTDLPTSNDPARNYDYINRFIYPQSEYDNNAKNVSSEGTVTPVSPKIFWMP